METETLNILEIIIIHSLDNIDNMEKLLKIMGLINWVGVNVESELNRILSKNHSLNRDFIQLKQKIIQYETSILIPIRHNE